MKRVELPPGSGRVAEYDEREQEMMREILVVGGSLSELAILHDLKVEFGVNLADFEDDEA